MKRNQYPLTEKAKEMARQLVEQYNRGSLDQLFTLVDMTAGSGRSKTCKLGLGASSDCILPEPILPPMLELANFRLIQVFRKSVQFEFGHGEQFEVLILQELFNAVQNGFLVSDYFLTMNAVGTIVQGNLTLGENSSFQSAVALGDVNQSMEYLVDNLRQSLGIEFLDTHKELANAISELAKSSKENQVSGLGKVFLQLARSLEHGANAATISAALFRLAQFFYSV